jgi:hypothetical protein
MFKSHVWPTVMVKQLNVTITVLSEYISYKITPGSEKDYRASSNTSFILSVAWMASTGTHHGRGMSSFLPLAQTGLLDSNWPLVYLWQQKASFSRLMVATQQVREKMTWGLFHKEGLTRVCLAERCGYNLYQKLLWLILSCKFFSECDIDPTIESTVAILPRRIDWSTNPTSQPYQSRLL